MNIPCRKISDRVAIEVVAALCFIVLLAAAVAAQAEPGQSDAPKLFVDCDDHVLDNYAGASAELKASTNSASDAAQYEGEIPDTTVRTARLSVTTGVFVSGSSATASASARAVDIEGNDGQWSNSASTSIILSVPMPANPDGGQVTLTWNNTDNENVVKYQLRENRNDWADIEDSKAGTHRHPVKNLTAGRANRLQNRAVNANGLAEASRPVTESPGSTPGLVASTASPFTEATLNGSVVKLTLSGGTFERWNNVRNNVKVSGIAGVSFRSSTDVARVSDTEVTVKLSFGGNIDADASLVFTVGAGAIASYSGSALTAEILVAAITETLNASVPQPLTEATLAGSVVKLTLNGRTFERWNSVRNNVTVSGIDGVSFRSSTDVERLSDTEATVKLSYRGNIDADATLVFTVGAGAIAGYSGPALTAEISVTAVTETLTASVSQPLTEATLNGSVVKLTLSTGAFERWNDVRNNLTVSGIDGVTFRSSTDVERLSDTEATVKLSFSGNMDEDATLVFTVGAGAIAGYTGPALTAEIPVTAINEATPDFDGDGTVGFADFLQFASVFGTSRGDTEYNVRFDLDGDGAIGFSDFLMFAENFGKDVTSSGSDSGGDGNGDEILQTCAEGMMLRPGEGCRGSGYSFRNDAGVLVGQGNVGRISIDNARFDAGNVRLNQLHLTRSGNVWTIVSLP